MKSDKGSNDPHPEQSLQDEVIDGRMLVSRLSALRERAQPLLDHATELLKSRPYLTIGLAVGAGFVLGVSVFSRFARLTVLGAASLGAELLHDVANSQSARQQRAGAHSS